MLSVALAAVILGTLLPPAGTGASVPFGVTLNASSNAVGTGNGVLFQGHVFTAQGVGIPQVDVTLFRNGTPLLTRVTDHLGQFNATVIMPATPGDYGFWAHADAPGALMSGDSPLVKIKVRLRPLPPQNLTVVTDNGATSVATLTWQPPADLHDAPLKSYRLSRIGPTGSKVLATLYPNTLSFVDPEIGWNATYRYYVQSTTFAGDSVPSNWGDLVMPIPAPGTITSSITVLDACSPQCASLWPGTYNFRGASLTLKPKMGGNVWTTGGEPIPDTWLNLSAHLTVACGACSPTSGDRTATAKTGSGGAYSKVLASFAWSDYALNECRDFTFATTSDAAGVTGSSTKTWRFCRTS